jgi:RNA polymerase sigma-70 factor, ECF subfamily
VVGLPVDVIVNAHPAGHRRWSNRLRRESTSSSSFVELAGGDGGGATVLGAEPVPAPAPLERERELLAGAAAGQADAVAWLLDQVAPIVFGFLFARVGGDEAAAEDLLQETLLEAVRGAGAFRAESSASTWMCAIARRRLARYYESERRAEVARRSLSLVHGGLGSSGPGEDVLERQDEVVRALGRLPALQRQVLVLKYLEDMSVVEIAEQVNRSRVQVQSLLQRGREGLRRELGGSAGGNKDA